MKAFSFRLQGVLRYRDYLEKKALKDLFYARELCRGIERKIEKLGDQRVDIASRCSDEGFKGIHVPLYQIYKSFLEGLDMDLQRAHEELKTAEKNAKAKEATLKKESIKKKTLETLKDLKLEKYKEEQEKEEQKQIDEMVVLRARQ